MAKFLFLIAATAILSSASPGFAADFSTGEYALPDHVTCLEMAREEGRLIVAISALHPVVKHDKESEQATRTRELKSDRKAVHRERRLAECI